jgi:hypothetical protein
MISDLEQLTTALRGVSGNDGSNAQKLANKIKSDPQVQRDLETNGCARIEDEEGRTFVVRRTHPSEVAV